MRLGLEPAKPVKHTIHCFNYLRQSHSVWRTAHWRTKIVESHGRNVLNICNNYDSLLDWIQDPVRKVLESILDL